MTQIITSRGGGQGGGGGGGDGDMKKAVYDPQNIGKDAFDYDNFTNTPDIPTEVSELDNDAGYITSAALSGYQTTSNLVTNLTNPDDTHYPSAKAVSDAITSSGGGDMLKSVYDPDNISANAFDYDNFINTPTIPTDTSDLTNGAGYITGIDSSDVITALGYTPYNSTNPNGYITGISSGDVTTALGYTPYNSTNPSGYVTSSIISNTAYGSGWNGDTTHAPTKDAVYDKINSIDGLIPSTATSSNKLTDKNYVDDGINSVTAYYITKNAAGDQWASYAELAAATTFYSGGVVRTPTRNDYTIVLDDENHDHATTRYIYNSGWEYQYTVNETPLTTAQLNALNSGITSAKVSTYDGYASTISGKQDALSTQTAYTSKGTSTKVPTITTNTLGQVTSISETSIAFPVTSVNGQTGAVTISEGNTKTFYASTSSQWNTTLGQQIYDWIKNGNYAILQYGIQNVVIFTPTNTTTGSIYSQGYYTVRGSGDELESVATTYGITVSSGTVTAVDTSPTVSSVGNFFSPGGTATTGYVVTKTASGYEWQAPSGLPSGGTNGQVLMMVNGTPTWVTPADNGFVMQALNSPIAIKYIWAGQQSAYDGLSSYDNNTHYDTI